MTVYIGEPGMPKPRMVRDPDEALRAERLSLIGAEVDRVLDDRPPVSDPIGRTIIVAFERDGVIYTREIPEAA